MLLLSTAAEHAVLRFDPRPLRGKRTWVVVEGLETEPERHYIRSAVRDHLAWHDVPVARSRADADVVLEVRAATGGTYDAQFKVGLPPLPFPVPPGFSTVITPDLSYGYELHEGWVLLQPFARDARTGRMLLRGQTLWGSAWDGITEDIWPKGKVVPPRPDPVDRPEDRAAARAAADMGR
jgi:hypothetical protein